MCRPAIYLRPLILLCAVVCAVVVWGCKDPETDNNSSADAEDVTSDASDTVSDDGVSDADDDGDDGDATDDASDVSDTSDDVADGSDTAASSTDADGGGGDSDMTDLLFVVDNSGGMCEEQHAFSERLGEFVNNLDLDQTSYHFGVTTTHQTPEGLPDDSFTARYGELTSKPNPVPTTFGDCGSNPTKVETTLERAIECTTTPSQYSDLTPLDATERDCIEDRTNCTISGFRTEDLFPPDTAYRTIPRVIQSEAYRQGDGTLDTDQLVADLRCATFVGTRGWSFEKGLGAAAEAVSQDKATVNSGFIRDDSDFATVFVSDENDCTHDGGIDELNAGACVDDACAFENSTQVSVADSALVSIPDLKSTLISNLMTLKSRSDFGEDNIFVAGIYGSPDRYDGDTYTPDECGMASYPGISPSCQGDFGDAGSGDRYQRFIEAFPTGYPAAGASSPGKICSTTGFTTAMSEISTQLANWSP